MNKNLVDAEMSSDLLSEVDFLYEAGYLKRLKRSGWLLAGLRDGESVAEHVFRTAIVGFVLACLENADPYKVATLCLFHDIQEARVSDLNPLTKHYFDQDSAEATARKELLYSLDDSIAARLTEIFDDYSARSSKEAILARDADVLECIVQAYEYKESGWAGADKFVSGEGALQPQLTSASAAKLARLAETRSSSEWWKAVAG